MFGYLLLAFTVTPVVELFVLIKIGSRIGALNTVAVVIVTGAAGALLARAQGMAVIYRIRDSVNNGLMPGEEILNGIMILCGGVLFLTPGFITDLLGFFMLIPVTRKYLKVRLREKIRRMIDDGRIITLR